MSAVMADVVAIRVPRRTWRSEARAVRTVWRREWIRFLGDRMHMIMWLVQPLLFLFVLGSGLNVLSEGATGGVELRTFIFPGVLCMVVVLSGVFTAASLVWDRELGFLRELLVAPVSRTSIILGKVLAGATIAAAQGVVILALAGLADVPYDATLLLGAFGLLLLVAFTMTAFGVLVAVVIKQAQSFTMVLQMAVMPLLFASGAFFPVNGLPGWLEVLNRVNPITYAVDVMRHLVFSHLDVSEGARRTLDPGITWFDWRLPPLFEAGLVLALGLALLVAASRRFARAD